MKFVQSSGKDLFPANLYNFTNCQIFKGFASQKQSTLVVEKEILVSVLGCREGRIVS